MTDTAKMNEAANKIAEAVEALQAAGLTTLADAARDLQDRVEAVLEGDSPILGDDE
ncbi:hypothetical protein [Roseibium sp. RKSG952]|uniref:hypothetical protein n=1 Tax=Roseibium sp. RKSG952 TaxID=2529384 RepID=UPI0012BC33F8|nr:hypothetical protein [Roseibium sp. RKSG952]